MGNPASQDRVPPLQLEKDWGNKASKSSDPEWDEFPSIPEATTYLLLPDAF